MRNRLVCIAAHFVARKHHQLRKYNRDRLRHTYGNCKHNCGSDQKLRLAGMATHLRSETEMKCSAGSGRVIGVALDCRACNTENERYSPAVTCHELPHGFGRLQLLRPWLLSSVSLAVIATTLAAVDAGRSPAAAQTCTPVANGGSLGGANPTSTTCTGPFNTNINFGGVNTPPPRPRPSRFQVPRSSSLPARARTPSTSITAAAERSPHSAPRPL